MKKTVNAMDKFQKTYVSHYHNTFSFSRVYAQRRILIKIIWNELAGIYFKLFLIYLYWLEKCRNGVCSSLHYKWITSIKERNRRKKM